MTKTRVDEVEDDARFVALSDMRGQFAAVEDFEELGDIVSTSISFPACRVD